MTLETALDPQVASASRTPRNITTPTKPPSRAPRAAGAPPGGRPAAPRRPRPARPAGPGATGGPKLHPGNIKTPATTQHTAARAAPLAAGAPPGGRPAARCRPRPARPAGPAAPAAGGAPRRGALSRRPLWGWGGGRSSARVGWVSVGGVVAARAAGGAPPRAAPSRRLLGEAGRAALVLGDSMHARYRRTRDSSCPARRRHTYTDAPCPTRMLPSKKIHTHPQSRRSRR